MDYITCKSVTLTHIKVKCHSCPELTALVTVKINVYISVVVNIQLMYVSSLK